MKTIVIAAGYATRLGELTRNFPKPLLKIGGSTILGRMLEDIDTIPQIDGHIVVTNHKFAPIFEEWAAGQHFTKPLTILDDGTTSNENRLGAVRDLLFALETQKIDDDILVVAADNLLMFPMHQFVDFALAKGSSCIMCHKQPSVEKLRRTGVVVLDENDRVLEMAEKPQEPKTEWAVPPFYIYLKKDLGLVRTSIENGCGVDAPGNLAHYMVDHTVMHAWKMSGGRFDIGSPDTYMEACEKYGTFAFHIFSPYRVCPLGAHVDHQKGIVTGFAIDKGVDLWFNVRNDSKVSLRSLSFDGPVDFDLSTGISVRDHSWGDYARGAAYALKKRFTLEKGIEGIVRGSLPVGGLSSSAAVLVAYVMAFAKASGINLKPFEVVQIASEAEREYIGLNNGLLDQACIALGKKDGLLFLDCDTNQWRIIDRNPDMPEFEIGIFFSGLTRSLVGSDYNLRVCECKTAAWCMLAYQELPLKTFDKTFLRDIPRQTFEKTRDLMPARFARRAEHFYSEYRRVRQGVTAWESGNLQLFGKLSFDSCESSIHNYECGSPELISIYNIIRSLPGVYGGRFSGAGFKGAVVALVDPGYKEAIERELTEKYLAEYPEYENTFKVYWVKPADGAGFCL